MKPGKDHAIWVFDSHCVLCEGGVRYTLKHEKTDSIRFVALQSREGRDLALRHGVDSEDPATFLFIENGIALEKSDAVIALSRHLNSPPGIVAFIAPLVRILPKGVRDVAYEIVARNRYRLFGRKDACILPSAENRHRFSL